MTDNEIIKALECCFIKDDCTECPNGRQCRNDCCDATIKGFVLMGIDLINRQQAEIDDLKRDTIPRLQNALKRANEIGMNLEKENQELKTEIEKLKKEVDATLWDLPPIGGFHD